jgi:hypothetical protein
MSKGGRPYILDAVRYACGKINRAETEKALAADKKRSAKDDAGTVSPKVRRNRDLFNARCFKGGGQGSHAGDAIGQMWLLGLLEAPDMDDTRLLNAARAWWHGRSVMFKGLDYKTASYERKSPSSSHSTKLSKAEKDYQRYASFLLDASDYDQDCLASLMETTIDDDFPSWVSRIIQTELARHIRLPLVELATDLDKAMLAAAKRALIAMSGGEAFEHKRVA